jgi:sugar phosphate isomerase/epimerase
MPTSRKMRIHLSPGAIGVRVSPTEIIDLAHYYGYEAIEPQTDYLTKIPETELKRMLERMQALELVWGPAGIGVDFRGTDDVFEAGMKALPAQADALERAGVTRAGAWILPAHDQLTSRSYFDLHVKRLGAVADVLGAHGVRLGLEYVAPKTSWTRQRYPFIHTMAEMKELIAAIGKKNVGFVLDSWHWYTAQETKADLLTLQNSDVVTVDLNDAPSGIPVDQQIDNRRELPCATGVIDVTAFLSALQQIGYNGPVRAEPFNEALRKMPREQALITTMEAMKKAFSTIETKIR